MKHHVEDTVKLLGSDLKRFKCWKGGHYRNLPSVGRHAVYGINSGLGHCGNFHLSSNEPCIGCADNYGRPCFKDVHGWKRTDPTDGTSISYDCLLYTSDAADE